MKKLIFGIILGVALALPIGALAWNGQQMARPLIGADCSGPWKVDKDGITVQDKDHNYILDPSNPDGRCSATVYVFDDQGNKCYVLKGSNASGISCVKK